MAYRSPITETESENGSLSARSLDPPAKGSASAEGYDELTDKLFAGTPLRTILFSAVGLCESLSGVVTELAVTMSRRHGRVVVVDGTLQTVLYSSCGNKGGREEHESMRLRTPEGGHLAEMAALRSRYDFVLVDCGALASSLQLSVLLPGADGVVLVVESGKAQAAQAAAAVAGIQAEGGSVVGFVLTGQSKPLPKWLRWLRLF